MEPLEVKSVTFYQTVRLNGQEEKTVGHGSSRNAKNTQIVFCEDKIIIRDPDWKRYCENTVSIIGLHNVRHFSVDVENFKESKYRDVFKVIKKKKEEVVVTPLNPLTTSPAETTPATPATPVAPVGSPVNPKIGTVATQVDDPSFELMDTGEKQILLKLELKRFKIDFDNRWGVKKLLEQFNIERAKI